MSTDPHDADELPIEPSPPRRPWLRRLLRRVVLALLVLVALTGAFVGYQAYQIAWMPGASYAGPLPVLTGDETEIRDNLRRHVEHLAGEIGIRHHTIPANYRRAMEYIADQFRAGGYEPAMINPWRIDGTVEVANVVAELRGTTKPDEILILGAHYDTVRRSPGANDNASAVAALIEIARMLKSHDPPPARTIRFVAFYNEEHNPGGPCGSEQYARDCRARNDNIVGMISMDEIGYYTDAPNSQHYPFPFSLLYPSTGNFLAFVGNTDSRDFTRQTIGAFRAHAKFPSKGAAVPPMFGDAARSDHVWFWRNSYKALMITDTANFRYAHYHRPTDTAENIDYERLARVTAGLTRVVTAK